MVSRTITVSNLYYDNLLDYTQRAVKYKMDVLDPNLIKKFIYASMPNPWQRASISAKEVDD